ncbi:hypothetical protein BDV10DRAFT_109984 [Aspergillus recurvatus]
MTSSVESSKSLTTSPPQRQRQSPTSFVFMVFLDVFFFITCSNPLYLQILLAFQVQYKSSAL